MDHGWTNEGRDPWLFMITYVVAALSVPTLCSCCVPPMSVWLLGWDCDILVVAPLWYTISFHAWLDKQNAPGWRYSVFSHSRHAIHLYTS